MVQLFCKCLNVGIHCKETHLISKTTTDDNSYSGVDPNDDQFFKDSVVLTLALAGITQEHEYLCWTRISGQWAINQCAICATDTHAIHINNDNQRRILVNIHLESNTSRIESLRLSSNYSPVFRVVLPIKFDNQLVESSPVMTSQSGVDMKKRAIQVKVQRYLSEEQKVMEDRIRTFTEQEHSRFAQMQLQIGRNEESLYNILDDIAHKAIVDSNSDQSLAFSAKHLKISENVDPEMGLNSYLNHKSTQKQSNPKPLDNKSKSKSQPMRYRSQSVDCEIVGAIFDIECDDGNAFDSISYSDDEDEEESIAFRNNKSNNYHNYNNSNGRAVPNAQIYAQTNGHMAYSLPIQVPKWKSFSNHKDSIDEEVPMISNGENIAESIKKLAKSVRNESDIFGDRPRRRLNTGELVRSRPI